MVVLTFDAHIICAVKKDLYLYNRNDAMIFSGDFCAIVTPQLLHISQYGINP